uniref:Uncharacterized protein n=1 Tax=Arundo donax TaxID=35708 RepID=A0A0A9GYD1_ARUDO
MGFLILQRREFTSHNFQLHSSIIIFYHKRKTQLTK